jgi:type IV pilus assembly protein PilN
VILINLLPHREAARKRRREMFYAGLGASAVAGALVAGGIYLWYAAQIDSQQTRNQILANENKRLDGQIKDIAALQEEIAALRARQQAVEDLQADRNMPVHLLNELSRLLPDGVYLTGMKQVNDNVSLVGVAQSNERVSELLRNLGTGSSYIARPELVEIVAGNLNLGKDQRRVSNFRMNVKVLRASEAEKAAAAASAASAAAGGASAAAATSAASAASAATAAAAPITAASAAITSAAVAAVTPASARK